MSLYNALFGVNPFAKFWISMLGLTPNDVGRFRDCYLDGIEKDEDGKVKMGDVRVQVYTRNGGGNREEYQDVLDQLSKHPDWAGDRDDDFDSTYCTVSFRVPEKFKPVVEELITTNWEQLAQAATPPSVRWSSMMEKLQKGDKSDPTVKNALEVGRQIFGEIEKKLKDLNSDKIVTV